MTTFKRYLLLTLSLGVLLAPTLASAAVYFRPSFRAQIINTGATSLNNQVYSPYGSYGSAAPGSESSQTRTLSGLVFKIIGYLNQALVLLMGLAMVMFVWWVIQYYIKPNDERAQAGSYILYSVIGFFVIISVWGLVNILRGTFNFENTTAPSAGDINNLFPR